MGEAKGRGTYAIPEEEITQAAAEIPIDGLTSERSERQHTTTSLSFQNQYIITTIVNKD
jgi:hypothetical protein